MSSSYITEAHGTEAPYYGLFLPFTVALYGIKQRAKPGYISSRQTREATSLLRPGLMSESEVYGRMTDYGINFFLIKVGLYELEKRGIKIKDHKQPENNLL